MKLRIFALLLALLPVLTACSLFVAHDDPEDRIEAMFEKPLTEQAKLSQEEAVSIALENAGLTNDDVPHPLVTFEYDDGVPEYEVEFRYDGLEYEYTIHAETGKILSYDIDR